VTVERASSSRWRSGRICPRPAISRTSVCTGSSEQFTSRGEVARRFSGLCIPSARGVHPLEARPGDGAPEEAGEEERGGSREKCFSSASRAPASSSVFPLLRSFRCFDSGLVSARPGAALHFLPPTRDCSGGQDVPLAPLVVGEEGREGRFPRSQTSLVMKMNRAPAVPRV